jgi:hypothetical protein
MNRTDYRWIQQAHIKKGALHKQLGIPETQHIPYPLLHQIGAAPIGKRIDGHLVTHLLKHRAQFVMNMRRK